MINMASSKLSNKEQPSVSELSTRDNNSSIVPFPYLHNVAVLKADSGMNDIVRSGDHEGVAKEPSSAHGGVHRRRPANSSGVNPGRRPGTAWTVEIRASTTKHQDEATKMYDMLRKDYAWKARRRSPINNGEPLEP
ncbi:hypothetical protein ABZP36_004479 [Zizania latifolia]